MAFWRAVVGVRDPLLLYRGVEVALLRMQRHFIKEHLGVHSLSMPINA
jgi:hypothetical protein